MSPCIQNLTKPNRLKIGFTLHHPSSAKKMKGDEGLFFTDTLTNAVLSLDFWIIDYLEAKDSVVIPIEVEAATRGSMQSLWLFHYMQ